MSQLNTEQLASHAENFWNFACNLYEVSKVKKHLHRFQDKHAENVNRILFSVWLSSQGLQLRQALDTDDSEVKAITTLEGFIAKLRDLRNSMKDESGEPKVSLLQSRKLVLSLELRLEKVHQRLLVSWALRELAPIKRDTNGEFAELITTNLNFLKCPKARSDIAFIKLLKSFQ